MRQVTSLLNASYVSLPFFSRTRKRNYGNGKTQMDKKSSCSAADPYLAWYVWSDLCELMNFFYNDDLVQHVFILWIMAALIVYCNNAVLVDGITGAMRATVGTYPPARLAT